MDNSCPFISPYFTNQNNVPNDFMFDGTRAKCTKSQSRRCPDHFRRFCGPCPLKKDWEGSRKEWHWSYLVMYHKGKLTNSTNYLNSHNFCLVPVRLKTPILGYQIYENWLIFTHIRCPLCSDSFWPKLSKLYVGHRTIGCAQFHQEGMGTTPPHFFLGGRFFKHQDLRIPKVSIVNLTFEGI